MAADTLATLTGRLPIENHQTPGVFGVTSRFSGGYITVTYSGNAGAETVYLRNPGDSLTLDLVNIDQIVVEASSYPAQVLILQSTTTSAVLTAAPYISLVNGGNQPFHADITVAASGSGSSAITTPAVGYRYVITSVFASGDAAGRLAVVDGTDTAGQRVLVAPNNPAGGSVARFLGDPDGYVQTAEHQALVLVYGAAGNYFAAIDGYIRQG